MKLYRFCFTLILSLVGLVFSSCEDDDVWINGHLDISTPADAGTDRYGYFEMGERYYSSDIVGYNKHRDRLLDYRFVGSSLYISSSRFIDGDRLNVSIRTGRMTNPYTVGLRVAWDARNGVYSAFIDTTDPRYSDFIDQAIFELMDMGYIDLVISVDTGIGRSVPIYVEMLNDIDLYVSR